MAVAFGWAFEITDLTIYVTITHRRRPDSVYLVRVAFDDFPKRAPSYVFMDRNSKQVSAEAWPPGVKQSDSPLGICTPGTREFHEHYHKDDAAYPWDPERYTFLATLSEIHRLMERGIGA